MVVPKGIEAGSSPDCRIVEQKKPSETLGDIFHSGSH